MENIIHSNKVKVTISVKDIIEFSLRSGSLDVGFIGRSRAKDGTIAHQKLQKKRPDNYQAEVYIKRTFLFDECDLTIKGRMDGVYFYNDGNIIEEIKSTYNDLEALANQPNKLHYAQLKMYAFFYCLENNLNHIKTHLTYYNLDNHKTKIISKEFALEELSNEIMPIIAQFYNFQKKLIRIHQKRDNALKNLEFPFSNFRKGQREMAIHVYKALENQYDLFLNAPTGIGKTMGVIFALLKMIPNRCFEKAFYITARTTGIEAPEKALKILSQSNSLFLKTITITSKEKICFLDKPNCNPDECIYADGFFDKLKIVLEDTISETNFTKHRIIELGEKYQICPFELSLELSLYCDLIICDYNYVFDPRASLKRYFEENKKKYYLLIDEAHQLPDRVRNSYSIELTKKEILSYKKKLKPFQSIEKSLKKINKSLLEIRKNQESNYEIITSFDKEFLKELRNLQFKLETQLESQSKNVNEHILQLYFDIRSFLNILEISDDNFVFISEKNKRNVILKILCLNPRKIIPEKTKSIISKIIFSATLYPIEYFKFVFGSSEQDKTYFAQSPFSITNRLLLIDNEVITTYKNREENYIKIAKKILAYTSIKKGNYLIFFPSFSFLEKVKNCIIELDDNFYFESQTNSLNSEEREQILLKFQNNRDVIYFAVLGGIFSEGIDLVGEQLIGTIIVSVGLPQVNFENNLIRDKYNEIGKNGFEYAYVFPGFNKVLQASGRVIRTKNDRGIIILMDERFSQYRYQKLFPKEWKNKMLSSSTDESIKYIKKFWLN